MNGFAPNFTGYDLDQRGINWYDMYHNVTADVSLEYVRTAYMRIHAEICSTTTTAKICLQRMTGLDGYKE